MTKKVDQESLVLLLDLAKGGCDPQVLVDEWFDFMSESERAHLVNLAKVPTCAIGSDRSSAALAATFLKASSTNQQVRG